MKYHSFFDHLIKVAIRFENSEGILRRRLSEAMIARIILLQCFLALNVVRVLGYGYSWKECTWKREDPKDKGIIWVS